MRLRAPARRGQRSALKETSTGPSPLQPFPVPTPHSNSVLPAFLSAASGQEYLNCCSPPGVPGHDLDCDPSPGVCAPPPGRGGGGTVANPTDGCCFRSYLPQRGMNGESRVPLSQAESSASRALDLRVLFNPLLPIPFPQIFQPPNCGFMVKMSMCAHEVYKTPRQRKTFRAVEVMRIRCLGSGGKIQNTKHSTALLGFCSFSHLIIILY